MHRGKQYLTIVPHKFSTLHSNPLNAGIAEWIVSPIISTCIKGNRPTSIICSCFGYRMPSSNMLPALQRPGRPGMPSLLTIPCFQNSAGQWNSFQSTLIMSPWDMNPVTGFLHFHMQMAWLQYLSGIDIGSLPASAYDEKIRCRIKETKLTVVVKPETALRV